MISLLIVDDHPVAAYGLAQYLQHHHLVDFVDFAANAREGLAVSREKRFDVIVMDLSLPDGDGVDLLKQLKIDFASRPVMALSQGRDTSLALRAIRAGASAYLSKDEPLPRIAEAIGKLADGGRYLPDWVAEALAGRLAEDPQAPLHTKLSDRELEVMLRLAQGEKVSEIARELGLSHKTIATYRARLFEKLRIRSVAEATAYAIHNQLLS